MILRREEYKEYRQAFVKMAKALKGGKRPEVYRYFGLISIKDWWYLLFRTRAGSGAYLFLRLIADNAKLLTAEDDDFGKLDVDQIIWKYLSVCKNVEQAETDSEEDPVPGETTAENEKGPLPYPPITDD